MIKMMQTEVEKAEFRLSFLRNSTLIVLYISGTLI